MSDEPGGDKVTGLEFEGVTYSVVRWPWKARWLLTRGEGTQVRSVATFPRREDAEQFLAWFVAMARAAGGCE